MQAQHNRYQNRARDHRRQQVADVGDKGVERHAQGIFRQQSRGGQSLGFGSVDIGFAQFVQHVRPQPLHHGGSAGGTDHKGRDNQMQQDRLDLGPRHRFALKFRCHEPANGQVEIAVPVIEQDQRQQKVRRGKAKVADKAGGIIDPCFGFGRRQHAQRQGDKIHKQNRSKVHQHRHPQGVADDFSNGAVEFKGPAEVPLQQPCVSLRARCCTCPDQILFPDRLVERIFVAQKFGLGHTFDLASGAQFGNLVRQIVTRRQVDDDKDQDGHNREGQEHGDETPDCVSKKDHRLTCTSGSSR